MARGKKKKSVPLTPEEAVEDLARTSRGEGNHTHKVNVDTLRAYIKATGMSQRKFADEIGIPWGSLAPYLSGKQLIPYDVLETILNALNLDDADVAVDEISADTLDLKRTMLDVLLRIHRKVDMGSITELEFLEACRTVAPYVLSKVYGSGSFDSNAFASALLAAQQAIAKNDDPKGLSDVEKQQLSL